MNITPFVRYQLIVFAIVSVVALVVVSVFYIRIPDMLGIGRYTVAVELPSTGGLYPNANVTFRGVNVGKVESVALTSSGVRATLSVDSSSKIPANSQAAVRSVSAVGEQYVQFTPHGDTGNRGDLHDGSVVANGQVPQEVSSMLSQADALLARVQDSSLRNVINELFTSFSGTGPQLQRLLDSLSLFADAAQRNSPQTTELIKQAAPLLETQTTTSAEIRQFTTNLVDVTDQLRKNDPQVNQILAKGPGVAKQAGQLFSDTQMTLGLLLDNLSTTAKTLAVYLPNLRQIMVLYPRLIQALGTAVNTEDPRKGANADFSLAFQDPGTCTMGFLPINQRRFGSAQTARDLPPGMLCRVPQDSQLAVRGSRNFPCVEFPGRRAPTPAECRTGYTPKGENVPFPFGLPGVPNLPRGSLTPATPSAFSDTHAQGPAVYAGSYDPQSRSAIGPDGAMLSLGNSNGGPDTWQGLITGAIK